MTRDAGASGALSARLISLRRVDEFKFAGCRVLVHERPLRVETVFEDGTRVEAVPVYDADSFDRAADLGYEGDPRQQVDSMTRDHDLLHTMLAEAEGHPWSWTLHAVAHGYRLAPGVVEREERLVLWAQRLRNLGMAGLLFRQTRV